MSRLTKNLVDLVVKADLDCVRVRPWYENYIAEGGEGLKDLLEQLKDLSYQIHEESSAMGAINVAYSGPSKLQDFLDSGYEYVIVESLGER